MHPGITIEYFKIHADRDTADYLPDVLRSLMIDDPHTYVSDRSYTRSYSWTRDEAREARAKDCDHSECQRDRKDRGKDYKELKSKEESAFDRKENLEPKAPEKNPFDVFYAPPDPPQEEKSEAYPTEGRKQVDRREKEKDEREVKPAEIAPDVRGLNNRVNRLNNIIKQMSQMNNTFEVVSNALGPILESVCRIDDICDRDIKDMPVQSPAQQLNHPDLNQEDDDQTTESVSDLTDEEDEK